MDSVTRVAMAQREIGLAVGEPPTTKGYTPSVFSILTQTYWNGLEQINMELFQLFILSFVDGDDMNEPIADAVRGILDGHFIMDRKLAERGQYPAINVLKSISRVMNQIANAKHNEIAKEIRAIMAVYEENSELINIGAYKKGSNQEIDRAINYYPKILHFLQQDIHEFITLEEAIDKLYRLINGGMS